MSQVWTWRHAIWESDLSSTTKLVLQALASHLNDMGGPMFPSQERLAKLCSLSERAVITHLDLAEQKGWIVARKRELNGKRWAANEYVSRFPDGVNQVHPKPSNGVKDVQVQDERGSGEGVNDVHTNIPGELSREHTPNPQGGVCAWERNDEFMEVAEAYRSVSPERLKVSDAWVVWGKEGLAGNGPAICNAIRVLAKTDQWKRGVIPALPKFLRERSWAVVSKDIVSPTVLADFKNQKKAELDAYAEQQRRARYGR